MPETIVSAMLKRTSLFGDLSLPERLALAGAMHRRDVAGGTYVFRAGAPGSSFFLVAAGAIRVGITRGQRQVSLAELGPGDYFGEFAVIDGRPRSADAYVLQDSELLELAQDTFFGLLDQNPSIARKLLVELCRRLREADLRISSLATVDAAGRIVRALLALGARRARREGGHLVFAKAPRQHEVAALAGTTRATTSRILRQLAQQGLLTHAGASLILHERRLAASDNLH